MEAGGGSPLQLGSDGKGLGHVQQVFAGGGDQGNGRIDPAVDDLGQDPQHHGVDADHFRVHQPGARLGNGRKQRRDPHFQEVPHVALPHQPPHHPVPLEAETGRIKGGDQVGFPGGVQHPESLLQVARHPCLAEDMLAGIQGGHGGRQVEVGRRGDHYGVDVAVLDDPLPPVGQVGNIEPLGRRLSRFLAAGPGMSDLDPRNLLQQRDVPVLGDLAGSDDADPDGVRHCGLFSRQVFRSTRPAGGHGGSGCGACRSRSGRARTFPGTGPASPPESSESCRC